MCVVDWWCFSAADAGRCCITQTTLVIWRRMFESGNVRAVGVGRRRMYVCCECLWPAAANTRLMSDDSTVAGWAVVGDEGHAVGGPVFAPFSAARLLAVSTWGRLASVDCSHCTVVWNVKIPSAGVVSLWIPPFHSLLIRIHLSLLYYAYARTHVLK